MATMLGLEQEAWLRDRLANERTRWSLIGQATMVSRLPLPGGGDARWSDIWDGYAASRDRLIAALRQPAVRNAVLLGGDVHSFWANDIPSDPERMEDTRAALLGAQDEDLLPAAALALSDGLTDAEFAARYGATDDPRYERKVASIDAMLRRGGID